MEDSKFDKIMTGNIAASSMTITPVNSLQILMIGDNINWGCGSLEVVLPTSESFVDSQQLFVMNIIVQLSTRKGMWVESDRMEFSIWSVYGKNGYKCIIWSISFHNQRLVRNPVCEDWSGSECFLENFESRMAFLGEIPCSTFCYKNWLSNQHISMIAEKPSGHTDRSVKYHTDTNTHSRKTVQWLKKPFQCFLISR